jgi:twinkle protein
MSDYKDANEALQAGEGKAVIDAIWGAKAFRPDGLVTLEDIIEEVQKPIEWGLPWFLPTLTQATFGRRMGECVALGAGTGVGKTDLITQQVVYDLTQLNEPVGVFFLEQGVAETGKRLAGKLVGKTFHIPDSGWTNDELIEAVKQLQAGGRLTLYDSFGRNEWEVIEGHIRYLARAEGVRLFYLDHLTALAQGAASEVAAEIEVIMESLASLCKELNVWILFVSHLATPDGKPHEEGGRVMIRHFKGSRAIGFWSHFMFGLERNQQADEPEERQTTTFRILKDRYTGRSTGLTFLLGYDQETGQLFEKDGSDFGFGDRSDDGDDDPF